jgi:3-deoxy-D-manno-octulosonic-acid transferase
MLIFYDILYLIFAICYLPFFLVRKKYHRGWFMRLGLFSPSIINKLRGQKLIWIHAVSVGEVQAINILAKSIKRQYPHFRLVISTVTKTGNKVAQKLITSEDLAIYSPLDIGVIISRVVALINPQLFIVTETEIWPNLIVNLAKRGIPIILVNGRISSRSLKGYQIVRPLFKSVLQKFSLFCMQTEEDAQKIIFLGASEDRVKVTGNMKFDVQIIAQKAGVSGLGLVGKDEQLFIAGSTHRGEEKIILQTYREVVSNFPNLRLLLAPRHIERTQEIERLVVKFGFKSQRFSQLPLGLHLQSDTLNSQAILILDTIGQLKNLYAIAELVFVGGSLIPHGGQNPIEPAVFAKPILFGPYMSNFLNIVELFLNKQAAIMVKDAQQLKKSCLMLLDNQTLRKELGERAKEVVEKNKGASFTNLQLIRSLLD